MPGPTPIRPLAEDTDERAERLLVERWRAMTPAQKAAQLTALCRSVHELSLAGLRSRHPDANGNELRDRAAALVLGVDRFQELTGRGYDRA